jgi:hypothetical protein
MAASVFNFDTDPTGRTTNFTDTNNGVSATFSSTFAGAFQVTPTFFRSLTGNVLDDAGIAPDAFLPLTISFSSDLTSIGLLFAVDTSVSVPFTLTAFENAIQVGVVTSNNAVIPPGFFFPEGSISFSSAIFNRVVLTASGAPAFAIDNISVVPTAVPEPAALPLAGMALFSGLGLVASRRKTRISREGGCR